MTAANFDETFFSNPRKKAKAKGIPGVEMNRPFVTNAFKGTIGLELEIEGMDLPPDRNISQIEGSDTQVMWTSDRDGSLRGESKEYILSTPCTVGELPEMVNGLWKAFADRGTVLQNSNRCSTHVHINMAGFKINTLTSVLALWYVFEDILIDWCGDFRKTNHFCLSSKDSLDTVEAWREFLTSGRLPGDRNLKYSALNVLPLWRLGSFEFRCGGPPDEPQRVIKWATFLHHLVQYAKDNFQNPNELAYALSERGGSQIFADICNKAGLADFLTEVALVTPNFDRMCIEGFRRAQPIVLGFPWEEWKELIDREYVPNPFGTKAKKAPRIRLDPDFRAPLPPLQGGIRRGPLDMAITGEAVPHPFVPGDRTFSGGLWYVYTDGLNWEVDGTRRGLDRDLVVVR